MTQYDLVIVGGGPAGLAAAIYGGRARLNTLVIEKGQVGGQAFTTRELVNYPGYLRGTSGPDLIRAMKQHATEFGAHIITEEVLHLDVTGEFKTIETASGKALTARAVILCPGSEPRPLNIRGEKEFKGNGVSYCATCDAAFYENQTVVVAGNGDAAIEEALYLTKFAGQVIVLVIHDEGKVDCNKYSAQKAFDNPKISFHWNTVLEAIEGSDCVENVAIRNIKTGRVRALPADGIFIYVGTKPRTELFRGIVALDERGFIVTNDRMETSIEGVFAAGDAIRKYLRQVVTAVSDGAIAAVSAERFLLEEDSLKEQVVNAQDPVVLVFWSPFKPESLEVLSELEQQLITRNPLIKLVRIDTSRQEHIPRKYGVAGVPTVLCLQHGKVTSNLSDYVKAKQWEDMRSVISKSGAM